MKKDALVVMKGTLYGMPVVAAAFEFAFMGGSMGSVVGARFVRAVEQALEDNCPLICFSASGGARMQEALMSLMQMAKTSAALAKMQDHFFTRPGHQVKQDEFVGVALRHVVGNFAHVETNQIIRHVFSQFEAGDDFAMNFVTATTTDTVVGMIF